MTKRLSPKIIFALSLLSAIVFASCSPTRFLKENESILSEVQIKSNDKAVSPSSYRTHILQEPNSRWFNFLKVPLAIYSISGTDSTKRINRFFRRIGQAPVVYDAGKTESSANTLRATLQNKGYLKANVALDTLTRKRRTKVKYELQPGARWYVRNIRYRFDDADVERDVKADLAQSLFYNGMPMDVALVSSERNRIISALQNRGYYLINKEFLTVTADSATNEYGIDLTMSIARPAGIDSANVYKKFRFGDIKVLEDLTEAAYDSSEYHGLQLFYNKRTKLHKRTYRNHIYTRSGNVYRESDVQNTYSALNALDAIGYSSIKLQPIVSDSTARLNTTIFVNHAKPQTISAELEGTNTSGDLGAAVALTYTNRNLFHGSEVFSLKVRTAYEAIRGLEGYNNQNYIEYSAEAALRMPTISLPFLKRSVAQRYKTTSELSAVFNSQNRPEFHKRLLTANWAYQWHKNDNLQWKHRLDLISLNYVFMPWISNTFRENYLNNPDTRYSILRYSYENLLIMRTGYGFTYNSSRTLSPNGIYNTNDYQIRFNVEMAGNILHAASKIFKTQRDDLGQHKVLGIAYSQYAKIDFDYAKSFLINKSNSLALHAGFGIALPYGNSSYIPYEKRYFSGGANSVRGWSVRELGPGRYVGEDGKINFINQTGNLKLDLNVEYRTALFWKFLGAVFIDAGNVWNTRAYDGIEGGQFKFNNFYKQIAVSYGLGLRFNFDYFILRLDGGMKAINPAFESGRGRYPIIHPKFSRDFTLHFAVGLPF